ncbi:MAG: general secretion pathway protein GspK [Candidatus Omnitrophica bacterium]|nr:general secretion pathway protein GspK [Candidatus Omnitrophota bacterium]
MEIKRNKKIIMKNKGSVLVIALWLISTIAIFSIGLAKISWTTYNYAKRQENDLKAWNMVSGMVEKLKTDVLNDVTSEYDTLSEFMIENEVLSGDLRVIYTITDEERRININKAGSMALKEMPSMDIDKAVAIVNSELKPFFPEEELLLVEELEKEDYEAISDSITIYGPGEININTCSEEILGYLGMEKSVIKNIMEFRMGIDGECGTTDDGFFDYVGNIVDILRENAPMSLREEQELRVFLTKNMITVKSSNYRIEVDVYFNQRLMKKFFIILSKTTDSGEYRIVKWKEI